MKEMARTREQVVEALGIERDLVRDQLLRGLQDMAENVAADIARMERGEPTFRADKDGALARDAVAVCASAAWYEALAGAVHDVTSMLNAE